MGRRIVTFAAISMLAGCGGGGGDSTLQPATAATGTINVAITDAAVDSVSEVYVEFTGVTLKPADGEQLAFTFDTPMSINLLELQDGRTESLLPDTLVPVGPYNWMRLAVNAEFDNVLDSYVLTDAGESIELRIPGSSNSGLKLVSGFTVTQNQSTNLVIDWDLRKALTDPPGQPGMMLRPALRVTDMAAFGTLEGTVAEALTLADNCGDEPGLGNVVYLYEGSDVVPADIRNAETDPLVTATVMEDLSYLVSYLSAGTYTAAFTCQGELDDPEAEDDLDFSVVITDVMFVDGETRLLDFVL